MPLQGGNPPPTRVILALNLIHEQDIYGNFKQEIYLRLCFSAQETRIK